MFYEIMKPSRTISSCQSTFGQVQTIQWEVVQSIDLLGNGVDEQDAIPAEDMVPALQVFSPHRLIYCSQSIHVEFHQQETLSRKKPSWDQMKCSLHFHALFLLSR